MRRKLLWIVVVLAVCTTASSGIVLAQEPQADEPGQAEPAEPQAAPPAEPQAAPPAEPQAAPPAEPQAAPPAEPQAAPPAEPAPRPPEDVPSAVTSAVSETTGAMVGGAGEVAQQGQKVWYQNLRPMWNRFMAAAPGLLKALLVLLAFWIAAIAVSAGVRKVLDLTNLDEKAARDWGLASFMKDEKGEQRSLSGFVAGAVKALILLFGFVAFFDALDLGMVAGPLRGILDKLAEAVPSLIYASLILAVYWIIATLLRMGVTKALEAIGFDSKAERYMKSREVDGERVGPSALIGRLLFYVVLLIGIPPFLDALGQRALVAPLREMFTEVLAYLPNVAAAALLFFVGRIIAMIVREIVTNFLAATGLDGLAERVGFGQAEDSKSLSEIIGAVAYFFIMIPILVAAVDALQITAVSDPVKATLEQLLAAIPLIFLAIIVLAVGYYIAKTVRGLVESFLSGVGFDQLPERLGLDFLKPREGGASLSSIGGTVVMAVILLMIAETALATLQLGPLSELVGAIIRYLPSLFVGLVVILAALSIGSWAGRLTRSALEGSPHAELISTIASWAVYFLGFSMGLNQLGVGDEIIRIAVAAVLGGAALALGLAFGLGGRDKAQEIIDRNGGE